jgi:glycosyltransferase involved in cell wall biosynthesis
MRVAVDARALAHSRGVTRYASALLTALAREHPDDRWLLFAPGRGPLGEMAQVAELEVLPNVSLRRHRVSGRALFGAAAITGRPRLDRLAGAAPDVVWAPTVAPLALSARIPFVLTVQDLSFALRPRDFTAYERLWHGLARPRTLARRAQRVIVLAEPTRAQLVARWGLDPERVRVIAPGVHRPAGQIDPAVTLQRLGLPAGGYLLAVGALEPRKAPLLLARAFAAARARGLLATLVLVGEGRMGPQLDGPGVRRLGRVSDGVLDALYAGALALVVPSLLEGYGLPLREALARGLPAIVSDLPAFTADVSPAVLRVRAGDEPALTEALVRIERDDVLRRRLADAAAGAVDGLSWARAARQTRELLAAACAETPPEAVS